MKKAICFCVFSLVAMTTMLFGEVNGARRKPVVAITTFEANGVDDEDVNFVMHMFTSAFTKLDVATVVDRKYFDKIMSEQSFQISDWADKNKVAKLGKALGANLLVVGELMKRGSLFFLTIKILDVNTTTVIKAYLDRAKNIDDFFEKMPEFCNKLLAIEN